MANRNKARPGRSRKRRRATSPSPGAASPSPRGASPSPRGAQGRSRARGASAPRGSGRVGMSGVLPMGERPRAPWHPLPLSELLILGGAIGFFFGLRSGFTHGRAPLIAGLVALIVGTVEVTLREHLSGYRSHAL